MKKKDGRRDLDVGSDWSQISNWKGCYRCGLFSTREEAVGALKLAESQYMDGMGRSREHWLGLTPEEFDNWARHGLLPGEKK